jgi:hypothetical protein
MQKINYNKVYLCDTEILFDIFTFQYLNYESGKYQIVKCYNDKDIKHFIDVFETLQGNYLFFYNSPFDKAIINMIHFLYNENEKNIIYKTRCFSDYLICKRLNYWGLRSKYWENFFKDDRKFIIDEELHLTENEENFLSEFGQSSLRNYIKNNHFRDIPKMAGLTVTNKDGVEKPSLSLKDLQLYHFGISLKFNFNKFIKIEDMTNEEKEIFFKYCKNDVTSLKDVFNEYIKNIVINRWYAMYAVVSEKLKESFDNVDEILFSETNTLLIESVFSINKQKDFDIDYTDYINSDIPEFNRFVEFVNKHQDIKHDSTIKKLYGEKNLIFNVNGCTVTSGLGGVHGAISKIIKENLIHLDFESEYPSIILQYQKLFENIMNVEMYKAVYKLRFKYKKLRNESEEFTLIEKGLKLILNSCYGLINSNYKRPLSNKKLGRFICLKGQSLLYNLITRNNLKPCNINTDGAYSDIPDDIDKIIENEKDGYFKIDYKLIKKAIQFDVSNYLMITNDDKVIKKGLFNPSIKNKFNRDSKIDINIHNALRILQGKEIEILPIYFKKMKDLDCNKKYYLNKSGVEVVKDLKNPELLHLNGHSIKVSDKFGDMETYKFFAKIQLENILNFNMSTKKNLYYEIELKEDTKENNSLKSKELNILKKLFNCNLGFTGYKNDLKKNSFYNNNPIKPLVNYTRTNILKSTYCKGFSIDDLSNNYIIIDIDSFDKSKNSLKSNVNEIAIKNLKKANTFICKNSKTDDFGNCKIIFKNDLNKTFKIKEKYKNYIEILNKATISSLQDVEGTYYYHNCIKPTNISEFKYLNDLLEEKTEKTEKKYIEFETNNIIESSIIKIIEKFKIEAIEKFTDEKGIHIGVTCPFCSVNNTQHYQNNIDKIDAYINVNLINDSYVLSIHSLSNGCKNDHHKDYFKLISDEFKNVLPAKKEIDKFYLMKELKELEIKTDLFVKKHNQVLIMPTGSGKTFSSSVKILQTIINTNENIMFSTTINENIDRLIDEIYKVVDESLIDKENPIIRDFLDNKRIDLLDIKTLNSSSYLSKEELLKSRCILTNHTYLYLKGMSGFYFKQMEGVSKNIQVIIIDEYHEFLEKSLIQIELNKFYLKSKDSNNQEIKKYVCNCFQTWDVEKYQKPETCYSYNHTEIYNNYDMYEFNIDYNFNNNLKNDFLKYLDIFEDEELERLDKTLQVENKKGEKFHIVRYNTIKKLKTKNLDDSFLASFIKYLEGGVFQNEILVLENEEGNILKRFDNRDCFLMYMKHYFKSIYTKLLSFSSNSYKEYFIFRMKSIIDSFNCQKYFLTATLGMYEDMNNLKVNRDMEFIHRYECNYNVYFIKKDRNIDKSIIEYTKNIGKHIKTLSFLSTMDKITEIINKKDKDKAKDNEEYSQMDVYTSVNDLKSHNVSLGGEKGAKTVKNARLAYMNGTESTGKNYSDTLCVIINTNQAKNIKGRLIIKDWNNFTIIPKNKLDLIQAAGRLDRGTAKNKSIVFVGSDEQIARDFINAKKGHKSTYNLKIISENDLLKELFDFFNIENVNQLELELNDLQKKYNKKESLQILATKYNKTVRTIQRKILKGF